jgi:hypothetical protein
VTIVRAGSGRNSNERRPDRASSSTTNPFVSGASANDVRSIRVRVLTTELKRLVAAHVPVALPKHAIDARRLGQ